MIKSEFDLLLYNLNKLIQMQTTNSPATSTSPTGRQTKYDVIELDVLPFPRRGDSNWFNSSPKKTWASTGPHASSASTTPPPRTSWGSTAEKGPYTRANTSSRAAEKKLSATIRMESNKSQSRGRKSRRKSGRLRKQGRGRTLFWANKIREGPPSFRLCSCCFIVHDSKHSLTYFDLIVN